MKKSHYNNILKAKVLYTDPLFLTKLNLRPVVKGSYEESKKMFPSKDVELRFINYVNEIYEKAPVILRRIFLYRNLHIDAFSLEKEKKNDIDEEAKNILKCSTILQRVFENKTDGEIIKYKIKNTPFVVKEHDPEILAEFQECLDIFKQSFSQVPVKYRTSKEIINLMRRKKYKMTKAYRPKSDEWNNPGSFMYLKFE